MSKVLYVNKPKGITSFDICFKLRKVFMTKSIGHTGTLDPNAEGVMIILVDKACKANQFLVKDTKEYIAKVEYGYKTDTLDIDGNIIQKEEYQKPDDAILIEAVSKFVGKIKQTPPMTSAIKVKGKKLVDYQRLGIEVEIPKREVEIFSIEILSTNDKGFVFKTKVSSGTYIRTLMDDILKSINMIGTLVELKRTKVGDVKIEDCDNLDDILNNNYHIHNLYDILKNDYQVINYNNPLDIKNGKKIKIESRNDEVLITNDHEVLAIYMREKDDIFKCVRGLF